MSVVEIIVDALVLAHETIDKLVAAAAAAGTDERTLQDMVVAKRKIRHKQVADDQAEERKIL